MSRDASVQSDSGTLLHNPTINQQIRNRMIVKNMDGFPMIKTYKETFKPANNAEAKQNVKNDAFTMHENDYNLTRQAKIEDYLKTKQNMLHGEFKRANQFDNSLGN